MNVWKGEASQSLHLLGTREVLVPATNFDGAVMPTNQQNLILLLLAVNVILAVISRS